MDVYLIDGTYELFRHFFAVPSAKDETGQEIGAVRGVETIDKITSAKEITIVEDLCETMKFGSLCALGGFTPYPVMSALKHFPEDFEAKPAAKLATVR